MFARGLLKLATLAGFLALLVLLPAKADVALDGSTFSLEVSAEPFSDFVKGKPEEDTFGPLKFLGGLVLTGTSKHFGAISGIHIDGDEFWGINDHGFWLHGKLVRENGIISGFENMRMSTIRPGTIDSFKSRYFYDSEGLVINGDDAYVSFENTGKIANYKLNRNTLTMPAKLLELPESMKGLRKQSGLEGLATPPKTSPLYGNLIAVTERGKSFTNYDGWILPFNAPEQGEQFTIIGGEGYALTEIGFLPNGDALILERKLSLVQGVHLRIRHIETTKLKAGATITPTLLFEAERKHRIDNMEAMSVFETETGETRIVLMSDNNQSILQRNLLLEFTWTR